VRKGGSGGRSNHRSSPAWPPPCCACWTPCLAPASRVEMERMTRSKHRPSNLTRACAKPVRKSQTKPLARGNSLE
jgi:hypothetical protein